MSFLHIILYRVYFRRVLSKQRQPRSKSQEDPDQSWYDMQEAIKTGADTDALSLFEAADRKHRHGDVITEGTA